MKWIDYRERLGIGFNDQEKFKMLSTILKNYVANVVEDSFGEDSYLNYCQMIGEEFKSLGCSYYHLRDSLSRSQSTEELIAKYIAFYNTYSPSVYSYNIVDRNNVLSFLKDSLEKVKIKFDIIEDEDGIFVFPLGAKELDDSLVSEPLEWLTEYPNARRTYIIALQQYANGFYIRDTADNLRKAFEEFLKEFLGNNNDLNKNKKEVEMFLKEHDADPQLITMLVSLISHYYLFNNEVAKHNDKIDERYLEFLLYQTGLFIRMLVVVNNKSSKDK